MTSKSVSDNRSGQHPIFPVKPASFRIHLSPIHVDCRWQTYIPPSRFEAVALPIQLTASHSTSRHMIAWSRLMKGAYIQLGHWFCQVTSVAGHIQSVSFMHLYLQHSGSANVKYPAHGFH